MHRQYFSAVFECIKLYLIQPKLQCIDLVSGLYLYLLDAFNVLNCTEFIVYNTVLVKDTLS